jgi:hypothetical protein
MWCEECVVPIFCLIACGQYCYCGVAQGIPYTETIINLLCFPEF